MAELSVGFNFTEAHFQTLMRILDDRKKGDFPHEISSIYGSPGELNNIGSARTYARESTPSYEEMEKWLAAIRGRGLSFHMALNNIYFEGSDLRDIEHFVHEFSYYVDAWIVAHPAIIDMMKTDCPSESVIVSTIMNVHTIPQTKWIMENWPNVIMVCPALERNRNFDWLRRASNFVDLELLANEFCSMGGVDCEGLYRNACYHSQAGGEENWIAREVCMKHREENPIAWIKNRVILPQWLKHYENRTGVKTFKVTGRTHGPEFLDFIARTYMRGEFNGNLLALWGQLEGTLPGMNTAEAQEEAEKKLYVSSDLLEQIDYTACDPDKCGIMCKTCENIWENRHGKQSN